MKAGLNTKTPCLQVRTLGTTEVWVEGKLAQWHAHTAEELFFYLLSYPEGCSKDELLESLWKLDPDPVTNNRFRVTVYRIRSALGNPEAIIEEHGRYRLATEILEATDLHGFYSVLREAEHTQDHEAKRLALAKAVNLYGGVYLLGIQADWVGEPREEHKAAYVRALLELALMACDQRDCFAATQTLTKALQTDPYVGENHHQRLMCCLSVTGDKYAAIEHYRRFVKFLREEVQDTPLPETRRLAERIKLGEAVCPFGQVPRECGCPFTHVSQTPRPPDKPRDHLENLPSYTISTTK